LMMRAARSGDLKEVARLLDANPALAIASTMTGAQPVHAAHFSQHPGVVELLSTRGVTLDPFLAADLGKVNVLEATVANHPEFPKEFGVNGHTALHRACYWGQVEAARYLLDHGADPNAINQDPFLQIHPLGCAVATADVPNPSDDEAVVMGLVSLLLDRGANVNGRRKDGLAALHSAAYRGHLGILTYLLGHGADPHLRGYENAGPHAGKLAIDLAMAQGQHDAVELLKAAESM